MKIWIVNHYAIMPDKPGGTRHYELARRFAASGHEVTVIAAGFHYVNLQEQTTYSHKPWQLVEMPDFVWVWVKTHPYQKNNHHRILNMLSFAYNLRKFAASGIDLPDAIIGSTVHPFAALSASFIARKRSIPFWFEIRDLWPQTMIDNGHWSENALVSKVFRNIEKRTLSRACGVIALSPLTAEYLQDRYQYPSDKVALIPNGANWGEEASNKSGNHGDKRVMLYAGGMDSVHRLDHLLRALAAERIPDHLEVHLTGDGKMRNELMKMSSDLNLSMVKWNSPVPKAEVRKLLLEADFLFLCTSRVLYGSENKLAEYMEAGKPILAYTAAPHNDPVESIGCGFSAHYDDINDLTEKMIKIASLSEEESDAMGQKGRRFFEENLHWDKLADRCMGFMGIQPETSVIQPARISDAYAIALLHKSLIGKGFLASLPDRFLTLLYRYLIGKQIVYCCRKNGVVLGFVAATDGTGSVMKGFLKTHFLKAIYYLSPLLFSRKMIRMAYETFSHGSNSKNSQLPVAELLSVSVHPDARSTGVGARLIQHLENEFLSRSIQSYKVIAGGKLKEANRFYLNHGFVFETQTEVHRGEVSNVYVKELECVDVKTNVEA